MMLVSRLEPCIFMVCSPDLNPCTPITKAKGVIHGDIKPNNVLVYTEVDGHYRAKAIDFGYSSLFMPDSGTIIMPFSEFWTAPEQHHREILPVQARRMDAYSFGMLCLWLFFYNKSEDGDRNFRRDREDPQKDPLGQAYEFLEAETALDDRRKKKIQNIFRLTLAEDPTERTVEFTELLELLSSNRLDQVLGSSRRSTNYRIIRALSLANLKEEIPIPQGDFQVSFTRNSDRVSITTSNVMTTSSSLYLHTSLSKLTTVCVVISLNACETKTNNVLLANCRLWTSLSVMR